MPKFFTKNRNSANHDASISETCSVSQPLVLERAKCTICDRDVGQPCAIGEDFEYRTVPDTFLMMRCEACGLLYLNPRPATESLSVVYPDEYHAFNFSGKQFGIIHSVRRRLEARRLMRWCRGLPEDARILDVGCGDGFHLSVLRDFGRPGWHLHGVDIDERAVQCAQAQELDVRRGDVESIADESTYDLVLLIMTIEHLNAPRKTLAAIQRVLKPGGRLVIVTDNAASPDQWLFGERYWGGYHFPRHTYLFNSDNLRVLGKQLGFHDESIRTALSPVNWTYSIRNLLVDWQAPRILVGRFSLQSPVGLAIFTLLDALFMVLARGAILQATFLKTKDENR